MPPDPPALSDAAKAEIAEAVRIVASDQGYKMTREIRDHLIPRTPENDPGNPDDPPAPPRNDPSADPPADPPDDKTGGGLWWGPSE